MPDEEVLTLAEAAKLLRIDVRTIKGMPALRAFRAGTHWRIPRLAITQLLEGRHGAGNGPQSDDATNPTT